MIFDRLDVACELADGAKVLDIGGALMPGELEKNNPFAKKYKRIKENAKEYRVIDYQDVEWVDYVINFNQESSKGKLHQVIDVYKPDVILCMETLEHVNCHTAIMNELAYSIEKYNSTVWITIPNWWINFVKSWTYDHILAFFKDTAKNFIKRTDLNKFNIWQVPCIGKYKWWWRISYLMTLCQPLSWGFLISNPITMIRGDKNVWKIVDRRKYLI